MRHRAQIAIFQYSEFSVGEQYCKWKSLAHHSQRIGINSCISPASFSAYLHCLSHLCLESIACSDACIETWSLSGCENTETNILAGGIGLPWPKRLSKRKGF